MEIDFDFLIYWIQWTASVFIPKVNLLSRFNRIKYLKRINF